jgi:hypothetical protein
MSNVLPFRSRAEIEAEARADKAIHQLMELRDCHAEQVVSSLEALERTRRILPDDYSDSGTRLMDILIEGYRRHAEQRAEQSA